VALSIETICASADDVAGDEICARYPRLHVRDRPLRDLSEIMHMARNELKLYLAVSVRDLSQWLGRLDGEVGSLLRGIM